MKMEEHLRASILATESMARKISGTVDGDGEKISQIVRS
jgi:hypothetical protein